MRYEKIFGWPKKETNRENGRCLEHVIGVGAEWVQGSRSQDRRSRRQSRDTLQMPFLNLNGAQTAQVAGPTLSTYLIGVSGGYYLEVPMNIPSSSSREFQRISVSAERLT